MKFASFSDLKYAFLESEDRGLYWRVFVIRTIGNVLILSSVGFLVFQFYPVVSAEISFRSGQIGNKNAPQSEIPVYNEPSVSTPLSSSPIPTLFASPSAIVRPTLPTLEKEPINKNFGLIIEKIGANALVVPQVDPYDQKAYDTALSKGVAHAKGTVYPGEVGNSYMFAHNTLNAWDIPRYNAVFFLLHNLEPGDRITTFFNGERFDYVVFDKKVHKPTDLTPLETKYSEPVLSLQTCWPPGTTWQRLVVRAKLVR